LTGKIHTVFAIPDARDRIASFLVAGKKFGLAQADRELLP
jgi:hypothetical protein